MVYSSDDVLRCSSNFVVDSRSIRFFYDYMQNTHGRKNHGMNIYFGGAQPLAS